MYNEYSSLKLFSAFVIKVMKTPFNIQRVLDYYASVFFPLTIPKSVQMTRDLSPVHWLELHFLRKQKQCENHFVYEASRDSGSDCCKAVDQGLPPGQ